MFGVTTGGCWLDGYWWWVCGSGQSTSPQKFALWQTYNGQEGSVVSGSVVTSGALTAGQWNFVPLAAKLPLAIGATYVASTGFSNGFPDTNNQFGSGQPYARRDRERPADRLLRRLRVAPVAVQDGSGRVQRGQHRPDGGHADLRLQCLQLLGRPPGRHEPADGHVLPVVAELSRRFPAPLNSDTAGYTLATEFRLSQSCALDNIWYFSAAGAGALPTRCAIWSVSSQSVVSGTDQTSPSWSGAAGSGWVAVRLTAA